MNRTLAEIAEIVEGEVVGDEKIVITGLNGIREAKEGELTFAINPKYVSLAKHTKASAIIVARNFGDIGKALIVTEDPAVAFSKIATLIYDEDIYQFTGIHASALIAEDAQIGKNVTIGPYTVIEPKAVIGDNSVIAAGCYVGYKSMIGQDVNIYPNVTVAHKSRIGDRVKIFSGTVIGADGFGFEQIEGEHQKIPQLGIVSIEDDVEIGANVTIDRARFSQTRIGKGTKIDNLVQIGHNVVIDDHSIIVAQVGIGGSTMIGKNSILAGQAGVAGHLTIGEDSIVAAQAGVTGSLPANSLVSGYPARPHRHAKRVNAYVQNIEKYIKKIKLLEKRIDELESK